MFPNVPWDINYEESLLRVTVLATQLLFFHCYWPLHTSMHIIYAYAVPNNGNVYLKCPHFNIVRESFIINRIPFALFHKWL